MKNKFSSIACLLVGIILIAFRISYTDKHAQLPVKVTTWDALGYYMYLPAQFIYHDEKELKWLPKIDSVYAVTGGQLYQANRHKNGNYVFKYLEGVSLLQLPFFLIAHVYALNSDYPADGFSAPYQYAIAWGCLVYCFIAILVLRKILLRYYKDLTVAITLLLLILATNLIQYVAIEGGQSHGYIFPLYVFILYLTIRWHERASYFISALIGLTIGLAMISRPTEAVMLFIPLLWGVRSYNDFKNKLRFFRTNPMHIPAISAGGFLAILPQLLYWKRVTGSFIYDVGSKWDFLNPHFRVLLGWEKGWFIYTPVTVLFVAGLFFLKQKEFQRSVITFCALNIYIIISWHIWRYGGSYSCRALVQSYPVFALALAGILDYSMNRKIKFVLLPLGLFLIAVNMLQLVQYNRNIIHYDEMNAAYYKAVYLNLRPTPLDMSMLDTDVRLKNEAGYSIHEVYQADSIQSIRAHSFIETSFLPEDELKKRGVNYLKVTIQLKTKQGQWGTFLVNNFEGDTTLPVKIRLFNAISKEGELNTYMYYLKLTTVNPFPKLKIQFEGNEEFKGELLSTSIFLYEPKE